MTTIAHLPTRLLTAAALLVAAATCGGHRGGETEPPVHPPALPEGARLAAAERVELPRHLALYGSVEAERTASVAARVMAMVTGVRVQAGDRVRHGQALLDIDPQAAGGQLAQARGALAQARAGLALAERNHERYEALAAQDAASALELDLARMEHEKALGAVEQAAGAVAAAAAVAADSTVTAPFAGRVARLLVEVGDLAAPGRPLVLLESEGARRVVFSVPERVVAEVALAPGTPVAVALDAHADLRTLPGRVVEMSPGSDPLAHTYHVEVAIASEALPPGAVLPTGAAARGFLELGRRAAVVVPEGALLARGGLDLVMVREDDGSLRTRAVTIGRRLEDGRREVLSGLAGGERVVVGAADLPPVPRTSPPGPG